MYAVGWHSSDENYCHVQVENARQGYPEDIFDVSLYSLDDDGGVARDQSEQALRNLVELANLGLKTVELVGMLLRQSDEQELDWKAYYLSKSGNVGQTYEELCQLPLGTIRQMFEEDDWQSYGHDYELEDAVEQAEGWEQAKNDVLRFLGVEKIEQASA